MDAKRGDVVEVSPFVDRPTMADDRLHKPERPETEEFTPAKRWFRGYVDKKPTVRLSLHRRDSRSETGLSFHGSFEVYGFKHFVVAAVSTFAERYERKLERYVYLCPIPDGWFDSKRRRIFKSKKKLLATKQPELPSPEDEFEPSGWMSLDAVLHRNVNLLSVDTETKRNELLAAAATCSTKNLRLLYGLDDKQCLKPGTRVVTNDHVTCTMDAPFGMSHHELSELREASLEAGLTLCVVKHVSPAVCCLTPNGLMWVPEESLYVPQLVTNG